MTDHETMLGTMHVMTDDEINVGMTQLMTNVEPVIGTMQAMTDDETNIGMM